MRVWLAGVVFLLALAAACGGSDLDSSGGGSGESPRQGDTGSTAPGDVDSPLASADMTDSKVVVMSAIDLEVTGLRRAYESIGALARSLGGFVAEARIADQESDSTASLRLRVPASRHDDLLASLRELDGAKVQREETSAKEVTAEYTDLQGRIRNLQRSEAQYQELLGRAASINDIIQISSRLDDIRGQIEQAQGQLNLLNDLTDFATVSVTLSVPPPSARSGVSKPLEVLEDALDASVVVALVVVDAIVVLLVAALWLVPIGLAGLFGWKAFGRHVRAIYTKIVSW